MQRQDMLINTSILYRCTQKFYDKQLNPYNLGAGQLIFLILIYENEGITMNRLSQMGNFDKGTVTKGIQKLELEGYIVLITSAEDKRSKCLYTCDKTKEIIPQIYLLRSQWWDLLTKGMSNEEIELFDRLQNKLVENANQYASDPSSIMKVFGIQKLTLLDYPGRIGCTVFSGGCNFRCPFCQNSDLVFLSENSKEVDPYDMMNFLSKRKTVLDGVCISGGEPLLQENLEAFLVLLKQFNYDIKIDTNGSYPEKLKELVDKKLIDYVAMDIKNAPNRYGETIGIENYDIEPIKQSVEYLLSNAVPYEFRTTLVKEFHQEEDMIEIGKWIQGASQYYLQNFEDNEKVIRPGLHALNEETMLSFQTLMNTYVDKCELRGL